ncbi:MAG: hypothetical protein N2662_06195 [Bacteroidales bacterium]|nr:hypothetical protein [Bacteroidales bacterium]
MKNLIVLISLIFISIEVFSIERNYDVEYSYIESIRNRTSGNINTSAIILHSIIRVDSTCGSCYYDLSNIYFQSGQLNIALKYAQKAYFIDTSNYWFALNYANFLLYAGDSISSLSIFRKIILLPEHTYDDVLTFAELILYDGSNLLEGYNELLKVFTETQLPEAIRLMFFYKAKLGYTFNELISFIDSSLSLHPNDTSLLVIKAELYAKNNNFRKSKTILKSLINYNNLNLYAVKVFVTYHNKYRDRIYIYNTLDSFFFSTTDLNYKSNILSQFLNFNNPVLASYLKQRLIKILNSDSYSETIYDLSFNYLSNLNMMSILLELGKIFVSKYPDNSSAWGRYLLPLFVLEKFDIIDSLLVYQPDAFKSPFGLYVAGVAYYRNKDEKNAVPYLIGALRSSGNFLFKTYATNLLTDIYYKKNLLDSAFYFFELSLREGYADEVTMNNYAYYLALQGKALAKAEFLAKSALQKDPKNSSYLDTYAWVLYKQNRYNEALAAIKKAIKYQKEDNREIMEHYAIILYCLGKKDKAKRIIRRFFTDDKLYSIFFNSVECKR